MLKGIKEYFAKKRVKRLGRNRKSQVFNYHNSNLIGVVASLESETQMSLIIRYVQKIREEHGIRKALILFISKEKEFPAYFKETESIIGVNKKDFSFNGDSENGRYLDFLKEKFNILLDFSRENNIEQEFVIKTSQSSFKVGRFADPNQELYDFMINLDGSKDLSVFMDSLDKYLVMIDNKKI
jgi:hypothetical protein